MAVEVTCMTTVEQANNFTLKKSMAAASPLRYYLCGNLMRGADGREKCQVVKFLTCLALPLYIDENMSDFKMVCCYFHILKVS